MADARQCDGHDVELAAWGRDLDDGTDGARHRRSTGDRHRRAQLPARHADRRRPRVRRVVRAHRRRRRSAAEAPRRRRAAHVPRRQGPGMAHGRRGRRRAGLVPHAGRAPRGVRARKSACSTWRSPERATISSSPGATNATAERPAAVPCSPASSIDAPVRPTCAPRTPGPAHAEAPDPDPVLDALLAGGRAAARPRPRCRPPPSVDDDVLRSVAAAPAGHPRRTGRRTRLRPLAALGSDPAPRRPRSG